jgi:hypothetical protein
MTEQTEPFKMIFFSKLIVTCSGGVVYVVVSSLPATEDIRAMDRKIESRH